MIVVPNYSCHRLTDNLPVSIKDLISKDLFDLSDKVEEEYKEAMGMLLYAEDEMNINHSEEMNPSTKLMLAKEIVDIIFSANTMLAWLYMDIEDRTELFNMVYEKNQERGYYDIPHCTTKCKRIEVEKDTTEGEQNNEISENDDKKTADYVCPDYYQSGGEDVIDFSHKCGVDKDAYLFNAMKYIVRAGKKDGNSYEQDVRKAATYLARRLMQLEEEYEKKDRQSRAEEV